MGVSVGGPNGAQLPNLHMLQQRQQQQQQQSMLQQNQQQDALQQKMRAQLALQQQQQQQQPPPQPLLQQSAAAPSAGIGVSDAIWQRLDFLRDKYMQDIQDLHRYLVQRSQGQVAPEQMQKLNHYKDVIYKIMPYLTAQREKLPAGFDVQRMQNLEKQVVALFEPQRRKRLAAQAAQAQAQAQAQGGLQLPQQSTDSGKTVSSRRVQDLQQQQQQRQQQDSFQIGHSQHPQQPQQQQQLMQQKQQQQQQQQPSTTQQQQQQQQMQQNQAQAPAQYPAQQGQATDQLLDNKMDPLDVKPLPMGLAPQAHLQQQQQQQQLSQGMLAQAQQGAHGKSGSQALKSGGHPQGQLGAHGQLAQAHAQGKTLPTGVQVASFVSPPTATASPNLKDQSSPDSVVQPLPASHLAKPAHPPPSQSQPQPPSQPQAQQQAPTPPYYAPSPAAPTGLGQEAEVARAVGLPYETAGGTPGTPLLLPAGTTTSQPMAVTTPGVSASPMLGDPSQSPAGADLALGGAGAGEAPPHEPPLQRLLKKVSSMASQSPGALRETVADISSILACRDRLTLSGPGGSSRGAVGDDLAAVTRARVLARQAATSGAMPAAPRPAGSSRAEGGRGGSKRNRVESAEGCVIDPEEDCRTDSTKQVAGSGRKSHRSAHFKMTQKVEEELQVLEDTMIDTHARVNRSATDSVAAEGRRGLVVSCTFAGVEGSELVLHLLVPPSYPQSSPSLLPALTASTFSPQLQEDARSRFSRHVRTMSATPSLTEMVRVWDECARQATVEAAAYFGGGTFSSSIGNWQTCDPDED
eukprot:jgi/Mesen1/4110/ME000216S03361